MCDESIVGKNIKNSKTNKKKVTELIIVKIRGKFFLSIYGDNKIHKRKSNSAKKK